ncbi:hypothetical protein GCAAIG_08005 [Candidatus Electronema halotolerans]
MATIQWRPEVNALTVPQSYWIRFIPRNSASRKDILRSDALLFSLLDMQEGGQTGPVVTVTANGEQTLQGFGGSAVSSLTVRVDDYAALKSLIRNSYSSRLVDLLNVETA